MLSADQISSEMMMLLRGDVSDQSETYRWKRHVYKKPGKITAIKQ